MLVSPTQVANGQARVPADINTPVNQIANVINGNIENDNIKAGAAIAGSKLQSGSVTPVQLQDFDWFKWIPAHAYSSVIAGSWSPIGASGTGTITPLVTTQSGGTQNEEVQYKAVLAAGTYKVLLNTDKDVNRGIFTFSVDGSSIGTCDSYSATRVASVVATITTTLVVATNKLVTVNIKMATKNAASAGYYATFAEFLFVRTA